MDCAKGLREGVYVRDSSDACIFSYDELSYEAIAGRYDCRAMHMVDAETHIKRSLYVAPVPLRAFALVACYR